MIAAPCPRAIAPRPGHDRRVCPACRSALVREGPAWSCAGCGRSFPELAGIADLRLAPDRYLNLEDDRDKARRLAAMADSTSLQGLARAYYAMTDDVDPPRARRYLAHLARGEDRGEAFAHLLPQAGRVLEVGCGSGGMLAAAAKRGMSIEGVDIAARWLVVARQRLIRSHSGSGTHNDDEPTFTAANAEHLPWPDATFDAIFADSVLEHLDDIPNALREWRRVAKPGASLVLISPNRHSILPDPHVGLWGVGWLSHRWQTSYVRRRRGCDWPVHTLSATEAARLAASSGWAIRRIAAAPAPHQGIASSLYDAARRVPLASRFLRRFGPLWLVEAVREASP